MTSQRWQGITWTHPIWHRAGAGDTCLLYATGDLVHQADGPDFDHLVSACRMPVAMLFGIPNQPARGMREDDLIAHSFEQYLSTGELDWPLIFPMTRAILRSMDSLQEAYGYEKFIITGGSKRGWAAWLAALTGDSRVVGVAPMVFDNLNVRPQMLAQLEQWGSFSPKLDDYTRRQLQMMLDEEAGERLARLVDPFTYLKHLRCPVLLVHGTNDEFWTSDATTRYWNHIPGQKSLLAIPNVGHDLGDRAAAYRTLGAFARRCTAGKKMPDVNDASEFWCGESEDLHFHDKEWRQYAKIPATNKNLAVLRKATFSDGESSFDLTTPVTLVRGAGPSQRQ